MSTLFEPCSQLAGGGRLTGALQTSHQDHSRGLRGKFQFRGIASQDFDQFVVNDLNDLLGRGERKHDLLAERLDANVVDKFFYDLEVDIGFEQCQPDLAQSFSDILLGDLALATEVLEGAL